MNLREEILREYSQTQTNRIIAWVGDDQKRFDDLVTLFLGHEYRVTQRAASSLNHLAVEHPWLVRKHLPALIENLELPQLHPAIKRNTLRLLQQLPIPEDNQARLFDCCLGFLHSNEEPIAVKVFAMSVAGNICVQQKELRHELVHLIQEQFAHSSKGFQAKARITLKRISF
ncbi:MAG: hypothetical protein U0T84_08585 [Chitinophagales bacterium]